MIGRGAVNQKGPEATFLEALRAMKAAGRKVPVNFVFVAEGEEEIGSPHFGQWCKTGSRESARRNAAESSCPSRARTSAEWSRFVRGKGCDRSRAHFQRREMGPRSV